jgi:phosphoribosylaminoimidazole-succinocarboxamide synthase
VLWRHSVAGFRRHAIVTLIGVITMRRRRIYEGKAKVLFEGPEPGTLVQYFKDDATAFNNQKKGVITGKGVLNNRISEHLMLRLAEIGVQTHFVRRLNMREQLVRQVEIIPVEVIVRNIAAGTFSKRFGIEEGTALPRSIVEYCLKNDELGDPMICEEHITARAQAGRFQAGVRPAVGGRGDAYRPGRRDQP